MRLAWMLALVACGNSGAQHDAGGGYQCTDEPSPGPLCSGNACGNGVRDETCYIDDRMDSPCAVWIPVTEACDGSDVPTCASLGYGGGSATCTSYCSVDTSSCVPCGGDARVTDCTSYGPASMVDALAESDPAAVGGPYLAVMRARVLTVLKDDAGTLTSVGTTMLALDPITASSIAPLVDGWLIVTLKRGSVQVTHSNLLASSKTQNTLWTSTTTTTAASIAYGPGGHALVAWAEIGSNPTSRTWIAVVDANGAIVAAPSLLFPSEDNLDGTSVTTDGTSFFVAASGRIARINSDGSVAAVVTGFPPAPYMMGLFVPMVVSWGASTGWYAVPQDAEGQRWTARAFDATGSPIGSDVQTGPGPGNLPVAEGSDLVTASSGLAHGSLVPFALVRVPPAGTPLTSVGAGDVDRSSFDEYYRVRVTTFAGGLAAAWRGADKEWIALVAL